MENDFKTLYTLCREMNQIRNDSSSDRADRYMDILLSLLGKIEGGEVCSLLSPGSIIVGDNGIWLKDNPDITHYSAPEVIFEGHENDAQAQLFSLGLVIYFMLYSVDYYTDARLKILEIEKIKKERPQFLINLEGTGNGIVPVMYYEYLKQIMMYLTSWDPEKRNDGKKLLIEMYSLIPSVNTITFVDGSTPIARTRITRFEGVKGYPGKREYIHVNGVEYKIIKKIDIPYRPGKHEYTIQVRKNDI